MTDQSGIPALLTASLCLCTQTQSARPHKPIVRLPDSEWEAWHLVSTNKAWSHREPPDNRCTSTSLSESKGYPLTPRIVVLFYFPSWQQTRYFPILMATRWFYSLTHHRSFIPNMQLVLQRQGSCFCHWAEVLCGNKGCTIYCINMRKYLHQSTGQLYYTETDIPWSTDGDPVNPKVTWSL